MLWIDNSKTYKAHRGFSPTVDINIRTPYEGGKRIEIVISWSSSLSSGENICSTKQFAKAINKSIKYAEKMKKIYTKKGYKVK